MGFWLRVSKIDRRILFLLMGFAIVLPLLHPLGLPFSVEKSVQDIYDQIEALPPGARVLLSADYDAASMPEIHPFTISALRHLFRKKAHVVIMTLWYAGPPMVQDALDIAKKEFPDLKEGVDYDYLGFKEGKQIVMLGMGQSIRSLFPTDARGIALDDIPLMHDLDKLEQFDLMVNPSSGSPGTREWVQYAQSRYHMKIVAANTAVQAADMIAYYGSRQILGLAGGMPGAAQYEKLTGVAGTATAGLDVLNIGHLLIIAFVIVGNIAYFVTRKRSA